MSGSQSAFKKAQDLLIDGRAAEAVRTARRFHRQQPSQGSKHVLAAILIDASTLLKRPSLAREGRNLLLSLESGCPADALGQFNYNLGNAYAAVGQFEPGLGPGTRPSLGQAISRYDEAARHGASPDLRANLANTLMQQGRWIEALDELDALLETNPDHYNALAFRGSALIGLSIWLGDSHDGLLYEALDAHRKALALAAHDPLVAAGFRAVIRTLEARLPPREKSVRPPKRRSATAHWIWMQRLALNPCPLCRADDPGTFDIYPVPGILRTPRPKVPSGDLLAILNALLLNYSTARWLLIEASQMAGRVGKGHVIQNASSGAPTGSLSLGLLTASVVGFYGLFGRIATALNNCFALGHQANHVTFDNVWATPGKKQFPRQRNQIHPAIRRRATPPMAALYCLAESLDVGLGRYRNLRILRNEIEHRLAVVVGDDAVPVTARFYSAVTASRLRESAFQLARIAKAALWYFSAAISMDQRKKAKRVIQRGHLVWPGTTSRVVRT